MTSEALRGLKNNLAQVAPVFFYWGAIAPWHPRINVNEIQTFKPLQLTIHPTTCLVADGIFVAVRHSHGSLNSGT